MKELTGDLLKFAEEGYFDLIVHGCNCFNTMGSGIAKSIKNRWAAAYYADFDTIKGDIKKLGNYSYADVSISSGSLRIINAYTQYDLGTQKVQIDYEALTLVLRKLNKLYPIQRIGLPKIGSGLAGGDWNRIKDIIKTELKDMRVTLVYL